MPDLTTTDDTPDRQPVGPAWERHARRLGACLLVVALALGGAWLGVLLAGTEEQGVGPFDTTMLLRPSDEGGTTVETPPLGTLMMNTHDSPLRLEVELEQVDAAKARKIAANPSRLGGLEDRAVSDIRSGLVDLFVRNAVAALAGAVVVTLLVVRRVRVALLAGLVAGLTTGAGYYATWDTWNPGSLQEPRYTGLLTSAPSVVGNARDIIRDFDLYRDQLARLVNNVSRLYSVTSSLPVMPGGGDMIRVLHVSDLEIAPQAWDVISTVAHQYDVDVVVDSGDTTDHGSVPENRYLRGVRGVDAPYVWVRGNHDSMRTQRAMLRQPGVTVLRGRPANVAGVRFLGAGDPRFTPDNSQPEGGDDAVVAQAHALADVAHEDGNVDAVVYHDPAPAAVFDGLSELTMSGHVHLQRSNLMENGTWRMVEGSTGGSGLRALEPEEGPAPIQLSVLYLDRETKELRAFDHLTLGGLGTTSAHIEREIVEPPDEEEVTEVQTPTPSQEVPTSPVPRPTVRGTFTTPPPTPQVPETDPSARPTQD
ncbi:MAG: metallophosphoesterase family protein [Nocardioidaceae bacterium]